jgi:hypothetical protein
LRGLPWHGVHFFNTANSNNSWSKSRGTVHILSRFQFIIVIVNVRGFAGFLNREICFDASGLKLTFHPQKLAQVETWETMNSDFDFS